MKLDRSLVKSAVYFCATAALGIFGVALICCWPVLFDELLTLKPNSVVYKFWRKIPVDVPTDFYLFNWTNSENVHNLSVKPRFEEVGPYRFWQKEEKTNITWNKNGTVTFRQQKFWHYDTGEKNGNLSDEIITGSPISIAASYITRHWNYYIRKGIFMTLSSGGILSLTFKKTVGELLFDGYREPLIKIVRAIPFFAYLHLPAWDRFGWLYSRNGSTEFDGVFNMGTGINSTFGNLYSWEYNSKTPFFDGSCANVNGSTGQYFPRNLKKDWITVYTPELRRTSTLKFEKEETVYNILGYKYIAEDYVLDNGTLFPENECFCNGECVPSGMVNISNTRFGVPLFVSLPHFYKADPYYLNSVEGLKPDKHKHEFAMTVEPTTGIVIKINIGVQLSMLVQPNSGTSMFENVPKFFMPVMWTKQTYEINGYLGFLLLLLVNFPRICVTVGSLMILASVFMLSIVAYRKFRQRMRQKTKTIGFFEERVPLKTELEEKSRGFVISK